MELLQLKYFKAVAENGNLSQTAKQFYISPSSLSATIARLEGELGSRLFDRRGNRLYLNSRGVLFLEYVNQILSSLDIAVSQVQNIEAEHDNRLSVATTSPNVWNELFSAFQLQNPGIQLMHTALRLDELQNSNCLYRYDFVIASPLDVPDSWTSREILYDDDYPVLLLPPDHPLSKRGSISLIEAKDEPFIALTPGFSSRKYFDELCLRAGFVPRITLECDYMMRSYMIMKRIGIAMATAYTNYIRLYDGTVYVDITEPVFPRVQALYFEPHRNISTAAAKFKEFASNFYPGHSCRSLFTSTRFPEPPSR